MLGCADKESLISDAGKLRVLDSLLQRLKRNGHRVLIYSQMTRMIDLLEVYIECFRSVWVCMFALQSIMWYSAIAGVLLLN